MRNRQRNKAFEDWLEAERAATAAERWVHERTMRGGCTDQDLVQLECMRSIAGTYFKLMMADIAEQADAVRVGTRQSLL